MKPEQIRALRARLGMTQREFSDGFGLPWSTVRDWEQGQTRPDRAAVALLTAISRDPVTIRNAVAAGWDEDGTTVPLGRRRRHRRPAPQSPARIIIKVPETVPAIRIRIPVPAASSA